MSMSPFFYIEIYNRKLGQWEKFDVYTRNEKDEIAPVDLWWWNGTHELFSVLEFEESYDFPEFTALHEGLPMDVSNEMQKKFEDFCDEETGYVPEVHWFNLADALLYLRDNKTVEDYDAMENEWISIGTIDWEDTPKQYKENPLQSLIDRINCFLELADDLRYCELSSSEVRIIGWVCR